MANISACSMNRPNYTNDVLLAVIVGAASMPHSRLRKVGSTPSVMSERRALLALDVCVQINVNYVCLYTCSADSGGQTSPPTNADMLPLKNVGRSHPVKPAPTTTNQHKQAMRRTVKGSLHPLSLQHHCRYQHLTL